MRLALPKPSPSLVALGVIALAGCAGVATPPAGLPSSGSSNGSGTAASAQRTHVSASQYRPMISSDGVMSVLPAGFTPQRNRPAWMKAPPAGAADPGAGHVAVAQFGAIDVLWFNKNNKKNKAPSVCQPASSTNGIRIDRAGNLWVPNGRANTTTEYAPNCGAAKLTIADPDGEPADVAFDKAGNTYILNINNTSGPPTVNIYDSNGNPTGALSDPSFAVLFGVGSDNNGNVFVSNLENNVGKIVEFPGGKMPGTELDLTLGLPGTPIFDHDNNLIISDWEALTLDVFAPPYNAAPTTSPIMGSSIWCPLDHRQQHVLCGDADFGSIDVFAYPGGAYLYSYTSGLSASALVTGVAPDPPASYWK